ncbi:MAG: YidC/Oxa1 family membrane protein insertase [Candidatus Zambryskibacteria bacterium]|nr:YidC/Oxa1 family membrane protein insertase [Candidatus Zambryskibacteria bacterium]
MAYLYNTIIFQPFYNGFIFLMKTFPFFDAGMIVIIFTIIIKIIILPLSIKASKAQIEMKSTEKDLQLIKEKYKNDKNEQSKKTMEYYKERGINPFASIFILLIQFPILIGLYQVFIKSGLPKINEVLLYPFFSTFISIIPNMMFLGLINISEKSIVLALIAGITTYFQISHASNSQTQTSTGTQGDIAKAMSIQMKYFFPILMTFIAYTISSAIAIYFITSNLFAIGQEIYIRKKYHKDITVV